ncbi:MAG: HNH endonuclease [Flavobacterium sp.]
MVVDELLEKYVKQFKSLKRASHQTMGKAPHKPILLLSVLQLIHKNDIQTNRIYITGELVIAFKSNWKRLVETNHTENFSLPFFHLNSEPFWRLVFLNGQTDSQAKIKSISSFKSLKNNVAFAEIDRDLFNLLLNPLSRTIIEDFLLNNYFPSSKANYQAQEISGKYDMEREIEKQIVNDTKEEYQILMNVISQKLSEDEIEEERFIRGSIFKREVPKIYKYQCCVSGMRIESTKNAQMIDACHIVPFCISKDDTLPNGITLSPNLHRAYDRGLITINEDYIVRISPTIKENDSPFSISQFAGVRIFLPEDSKNYPSPENLMWHKKEVFVF